MGETASDQSARKPTRTRARMAAKRRLGMFGNDREDGRSVVYAARRTLSLHARATSYIPYTPLRLRNPTCTPAHRRINITPGLALPLSCPPRHQAVLALISAAGTRAASGERAAPGMCSARCDVMMTACSFIA